MEELSPRELEIQKIEVPTNSPPPLVQQGLLVRGDYRGHGDPVEPAYPPLDHRQDGGIMNASTNAIQFLKTKEGLAQLNLTFRVGHINYSSMRKALKS